MMRINQLVPILALAAPLAWTGVASAQESADFGKKMQFVVSGERLFGLTVTSTSATRTVNNVETESNVDYTTVNFLANGLSSETTNYGISRVGLDFLPIDGLTVGAALGFFTASGEVENKAGNQSQTTDAPSYSGFLLAPRAGYAFMFTPLLGIWPRGGMTFVHLGTESGSGNTELSATIYALTLEVPLVITPLPHAGFSVGPLIDLGLGGSSKVTTTDPMTNTKTTTKSDVVGTDFGIQAGLFVYF